MLTVRRSIISAVLAVSVGQSAIAASGTVTFLHGTLLSDQVKGQMTADDFTKMQAARDLILNTEISPRDWVGNPDDEKAKFSGVFTLEKRFILKNTTTDCAVYTHELKDKKTGTLVMITLDGVQRPLKVRGYVCLQDGNWTKYDGDKQLLVPRVAATAPAPAAPAPAAPAPSTPAPSAPAPAAPAPAPAAPRVSRTESLSPIGAIGPDHSMHQNVIGRHKVGEYVLNYKKLQILIEEELEKPEYKDVNEKYKQDLAVQWMQKTTERFVLGTAEKPGMKTNYKFIAVDQLALLVKEVKNEAAKAAVVKEFAKHAVIDTRLGDKSSVLTQFNEAKFRRELSPLLTEGGADISTDQPAPRTKRSRRDR